MQQVYWLHIETNTYLHSADKVIHFSSLICSAWSLYYLSAAIISKCSPLLHRQCIRSTDEKLQPLDWIKRFLAKFFHAAKRNAGNFIQTFWLNWWRRWRNLNIIQVFVIQNRRVTFSLETIFELFVRTWPRSRVVMAAAWKRSIKKLIVKLYPSLILSWEIFQKQITTLTARSKTLIIGIPQTSQRFFLQLLWHPKILLHKCFQLFPFET